MDKGRITLIITAIIPIFSLFLEGDWCSFVFAVGTTALIGCGTNVLAIRMLFDKIYLLPGKQKWALPCSGILENRRVDVAQGIGWVVSRRLLSPETVLRNISSREFQVIAGEVVADSLKNAAEDENLLENLVVDIKRGLVNFTDSNIFKQKLQHAVYRLDNIEQMLGDAAKRHNKGRLSGRFFSGLKEKVVNFRGKEKITPHLQKEMKKVVGYVCSDSLFHGMLKDFVMNLEQKFLEVETPLKQNMQEHGAKTLKHLVERMRLDRMVEEEVQSFPPGVLRDMMYRITAKNLEWLEVWGGALGAIGGAIFWGISKWVHF